jgi:hypothetical protein
VAIQADTPPNKKQAMTQRQNHTSSLLNSFLVAKDLALPFGVNGGEDTFLEGCCSIISV